VTLTTLVETVSVIPMSCHIGDNVEYGADLTVGERVWIFGRNITIGKGVAIGDFVHIVGNDITIHDGAVIGDFVTIGADTTVGAGATIQARSDVLNVTIDPGMTLPGNACYHMAAQIDAARYQN